MAQRIALVTGGMGGLGEAICIKLDRMDIKVIVTYSPGNTKYRDWLKEMEAQVEDGSVERMSKKDALHFQRERAKLERSLGGIKTLDGRPDALFVIDVGYHKIAVTEAKKLGIPIVAVVDTNHNPDPVSHVIPGNDDSSRAIRLYARGVADAVLEGKSNTIQEIVTSGDEFVEVADEASA